MGRGKTNQDMTVKQMESRWRECPENPLAFISPREEEKHLGDSSWKHSKITQREAKLIK